MKRLRFIIAPVAVASMTSSAAAGPGPVERVRAAAAAAIKEPQIQDYRGAIQSYVYAEGAVYRLVTAPEHVTDIALEAGEALVAVAAGDTARWTVGDTTSGAGEARRVHIMLKPLAPGLATNLIITTDRRVYHLALSSTARTAMAAVSWTYPHDSLLAIERAASAMRDAGGVPAAVDPVRLDFRYVIRGDKPAWRPLRAFDDGRQVYIEFPATLGQGVAPPLFVTGKGGEPELVNYRVSGRYYVVDRLFDRAELRQGTKRQTVVHVVQTREGADR